MIVGVGIVTGLVAVALFGLTIESSLLLTIATFCAIIYLTFLVYDLMCLRKLLATNLAQNPRKQYLSDPVFYTTIIADLNDYLISANQRLIFMEDQLLSDYLKNPRQHATKALPVFDLHQKLNPEQVAEKLVQVLTKQRASLAAFLCYHAATQELLCFTSSDNDRLNVQLKFKYGQFFKHQDYSLVGIFDTNLVKDMGVGFQSYGVRFYSAIPAVESMAGWQGLLWLGFNKQNYPELDQRFELVESAKVLLNFCVANQALGELNQKVEKAQVSQQNTEQFVAQLSHDLRSPLHNVKTVLSLVKEDQVAEHDKQELFQVATRNCEVLEDLVADILDYNKFSIGQLKANKELVNVVELVKTIKNNYIFNAKRKNIELKLKAPNSPIFVRLDSKQLGRVLANLIGNAIKFTEQGSVHIELAMNAQRLLITITDTGCGIESSKLSEVFRPFQRHNESVPGIGLGLTICKVFTELNGGSIEIYSDGNNGTTVSIAFPIELSVQNETANFSSFSK